MVIDVVWTLVLDLTIKHRNVLHRSAGIAYSKLLDNFFFSKKQHKPELNTKSREEFGFEKHLNSISVNFSFEEMTKVY